MLNDPEMKKQLEALIKAVFGEEVKVVDNTTKTETLFNIILVRQNGKDYMFQLPDNVMLGQGCKVIVDTRFGRQEGITSSYSIKVNRVTLEWLVKHFGATLPLKPVVGLVKTEFFLKTRKDKKYHDYF